MLGVIALTPTLATASCGNSESGGADESFIYRLFSRSLAADSDLPLVAELIELMAAKGLATSFSSSQPWRDEGGVGGGSCVRPVSLVS